MSTIIDVAREAGVSPITVSRYFNQPERLRPATRERVRRAVELLQYVPHEAARSLVRGRSHTIALILSDLTNPFFTTLARGVEDRAQELGYTLILGNTDETVERERRHVGVLISRRVDGVILAPVPGDERHLKQLEERKIPMVLIDRKLSTVKADVLRGNTYDGGRQLVRHLVQQGFSNIAFVGGPPGVSSLEERLAGFTDAIREAGLEPKQFLGRYDRQSGEQIMERLIQAGQVPRALVAANNYVAVGVMVALRRHRLGVPEDVALASFEDLGVAALVDPFLTVIEQPAREMGRMAMDMLLDRMKGFKGPPREQVLPVELLIRRSTASDQRAG